MTEAFANRPGAFIGRRRLQATITQALYQCLRLWIRTTWLHRIFHIPSYLKITFKSYSCSKHDRWEIKRPPLRYGETFSQHVNAWEVYEGVVHQHVRPFGWDFYICGNVYADNLLTFTSMTGLFEFIQAVIMSSFDTYVHCIDDHCWRINCTQKTPWGKYQGNQQSVWDSPDYVFSDHSSVVWKGLMITSAWHISTPLCKFWCLPSDRPNRRCKTKQTSVLDLPHQGCL